MKAITKEEWKRKKAHGFTSVFNGQKYILTLDDGAATLLPVSIKKEDKPEYGKVYALTGGSDQPSIMNGNNWVESEVKL